MQAALNLAGSDPDHREMQSQGDHPVSAETRLSPLHLANSVISFWQGPAMNPQSPSLPPTRAHLMFNK